MVCESFFQLFSKKLGFFQWLIYQRRECFYCLGNILDFKCVCFFFILEVDKELRGNRRKKGELEEVGRKEQNLGRGFLLGGVWKFRVRYGCSFREVVQLYGFFFFLGVFVEFYFRQLDISNYIGICEERNRFQGIFGERYYWVYLELG